MKLLSEYGTCDLTINGIETVDAFLMALNEGEPYDLILLDIMMPIFDGTKALKTIRKIEKDRKLQKKVKIIITTALNDSELKESLASIGFDEYLLKPIDFQKLINIVKNL